MNYRELGKTGMRVSEIGLGCEHLQGQEGKKVAAVVEEALKNGMNIFDVFMSEPQVRSDIGAALRGSREKVFLQGHIGAIWEDGQYGRSRDPEKFRRFFEDFMTRLKTDYVDIGMIHFVDTMEDYQTLFDTGLVDYTQKLRSQGVIKAVGMSSHNPAVAARAVEEGVCQVLLFSLNPAYDLLPEDISIEELTEAKTYDREGLGGIHSARARLYESCSACGAGITVMKSLGAGTLLDEKTSPFGVALTALQCVHYALTRPAVSSVLVGCRTPEEVRLAAAYEGTTEEERDYAAVLSGARAHAARGRCMYCNHCLPCPAHIDIAAVNRYLDLAEAGGTADTVRAHYQALAGKAGDCIACHSCEERCPFGVPVVERMEHAREVFGA